MEIPLKKKYTTNQGCKNVKNQSSGNGKRPAGNKISWKKGTGQGDRK
jgi:hypothetical protein